MLRVRKGPPEAVISSFLLLMIPLLPYTGIWPSARNRRGLYVRGELSSRRVTSSPATTIVSLLARAICLPASMARRVGGEAAVAYSGCNHGVYVVALHSISYGIGSCRGLYTERGESVAQSGGRGSRRLLRRDSDDADGPARLAALRCGRPQALWHGSGRDILRLYQVSVLLLSLCSRVRLSFSVGSRINGYI